MHKKDIIHSNLDLRHIFITENMFVKIIGFSDVKFFKGMAMKNLSYASPEEIVEDIVDHRTDFFSVRNDLLRVFFRQVSFFAFELNAGKNV